MSAVSQFADTAVYFQIVIFTSGDFCYVRMVKGAAGSPVTVVDFFHKTKELSISFDLNCHAGGQRRSQSRRVSQLGNLSHCDDESPHAGKAARRREGSPSGRVVIRV
jgi:hypothetical protein